MSNRVAEVIAGPDCIKRFKAEDWDLLVRQARSADLLARLYRHFQSTGYINSVPAAALRHLMSADTLATRHAEMVRYEIGEIQTALRRLDTPIILLKGAAYIAANLPPGSGRIFSDIDILVPRDQLAAAEQALMNAGWTTTHLNPYDQKYYRKWMHELPPLQHLSRKTVLDVHHAILPETARLKPSTRKLLDTIVPVDGFNGLYTLCAEDMILHSATHLFHDGEFEHGLRDLTDIDALLRHHAGADGFWTRLLARALALDLQRPCFYALHYCHRLLATPIPEQTLKQARSNARMSNALFQVMDALLSRGLRPPHDSCRDGGSEAAAQALYVRSHYLRMPLHLLLPHLAHKAIITPLQERKEEIQAANRPSARQLLAKRKVKN